MGIIPRSTCSYFSWADDTEVMALAVLYNILIHVFSSLGPHFDRVIEPPNSCHFDTIYLRHYAENNGFAFC